MLCYLFSQELLKNFWLKNLNFLKIKISKKRPPHLIRAHFSISQGHATGQLARNATEAVVLLARGAQLSHRIADQREELVLDDIHEGLVLLREDLPAELAVDLEREKSAKRIECYSQIIHQ